MKITAILVLRCAGAGGDSSGTVDPVVLTNGSDVSHFGYFQRTIAKEFIVFGQTVANSTPPGQRQSVQHEEYKVHSYNKNGLCALAFMDDHYHVRSAFSLLNMHKAIDSVLARGEKEKFRSECRLPDVLQASQGNQPVLYDILNIDRLSEEQCDLFLSSQILRKRWLYS